MSSKIQLDVLHDELAAVAGGYVIDTEHRSPLAGELGVVSVWAVAEQMAPNLFGSDASHLVVDRERSQVGHRCGALLLDEGTPWGEGTAEWPASGCGCATADAHQLASAGEVGDGGDQLLGVRMRG